MGVGAYGESPSSLETESSLSSVASHLGILAILQPCYEESSRLACHEVIQILPSNLVDHHLVDLHNRQVTMLYVTQHHLNLVVDAVT